MFSWSTASNNRHQSTSPNRRQHTNGTGQTPAYSRAQHLNSYLKDETLKRSTRRVSDDDSTFDTVFQTTRGETLIVRIYVPLSHHPSSPARAPAMTLSGVRAKHSWLDSRMRVTGYGPLQSDESWKNSRMLLGTAVREVVKQFQLNPPEVLEITDSGLRAIQAKNRRAEPGSQNLRSGRGNEEAPPGYDTALFNQSNVSLPTFEMEKIPNYIEALEPLSRDDLEKLLSDEMEFLSFVNGLEVTKKLQATRSSVLMDNKATAEGTLSDESKLKELHQEVTDLKGKFESKLGELKSLESEQLRHYAPPDKRMALKEMSKANQDALEISEQFADSWVEDGSDPAKFFSDFVEKRKLHHLRAAKIERLLQEA